MNGARRLWPMPRSALFDNFRREPDREAALARYAHLAARYEGATTRIREVRRRVVDLLDLQPGQTVFDVACGAGAILGNLAWCVGPHGHVIGIEQSPQMAALACAASSEATNVQVLCDSVESFKAPRDADALVFCYTHDVLQSPHALANLFAQARPGARVAVAGLRLLPWWGAPANAWVLWRARHYLTTWHGLRRPWSLLQTWCADLRVVDRRHLGTGYLATGAVSKT